MEVSVPSGVKYTLFQDGKSAKAVIFGSGTVIAANGEDTVRIYGKGVVHAGNGDDSITTFGKGEVTVGNGNDTINIGGNGTVKAGKGDDSITVHGKGSIYIDSGNDTVNLLGSGSITQGGVTGHDTINIGYGNDTINVHGHATVTGTHSLGTFGSATISWGELDVRHVHGVTEETAVQGQMTLLGADAPTEFIGGRGWSVFKGGSGHDTFVGGTGHDTMTGATGKGAHNLFEFLKADKGGQHVITNFVSGDKLYLEGHSLSYLEAHNEVHTHGGNTYITLDGGKTLVELKGFTGLSDSDVTTHK